MNESPEGLRTPERYIPQLESLRGWAILLVVAFHYFGILDYFGILGGMRGGHTSKGLPEISPVWLRVIVAGNTGVTLFFVLSGFLLTQPFIQALKSGTQINIRRFYAARLLRIIPLYYTAVFVAWLVSSNTYSAVKALLFIPVGFDIFPFSMPWWSLSTEMQFYLLLPLVMLAMANTKGRLFLAVCGVAWIGLHGIYALAPQWLNGWVRLWLTGSLIDRGFAFFGWRHGRLVLSKQRLWIPPPKHRGLAADRPDFIDLSTLAAAVVWTEGTDTCLTTVADLSRS